MKTIGVLLFVLLIDGISHGAGVVRQTGPTEHKPCVDIKASPASEVDIAAFKEILRAIPADLDVLLYVSHDPKMEHYSGAISFQCEVDNHEIYPTGENWTIYDPDLIQGDLPRDFVFAHEIAHHLNGDTSSTRPRSKELELRADYNGVKYLLRLRWNKPRLLHALDLLNLPQGPQVGYPTLEERKGVVEGATAPPPLAPPTGLHAYVIDNRPPTYGVLFDKLLNSRWEGRIRFQSVRTGKYVCATGTPDPKVPSTRNFAFLDNCDEQNSRTPFDLQISGNLGYWVLQREVPCPEYAVSCQYALESVGGQLQFWNQNLAADRTEWEMELGEQELFNFESSKSLEGIVRIRLHKGGYIFVDPGTAKLQSGGSREQAAEFKVLFVPN